MPSGFQDFWLAGSRFFFQRDPVASVVQPFIDFGVIQSANPTLNLTKIELKDPDGGVSKTVDEKVTEIDESYEITCNNFNPRNRAFLFLSGSPASFTQSATERAVAHWCIPSALLKLLDANGEPIYNIAAIAGVYSGTLTDYVLTAISKSARTLTTSDNASALQAGDAIMVRAAGLSNIANSKTYTVVSATGAGPTTIVVEEEPAADESAITGQAQSGAGLLVRGTDWDIYNQARGIIRFLSGGSFSAAASCTVVYTPTALTGERLILPQSARGEIQGTGYLYIGRSANEEQTARWGSMSITPTSASIQNAQHSSFVFTAKIISDLTSAVAPAGSMLDFLGSLPDPA